MLKVVLLWLFLLLLVFIVIAVIKIIRRIIRRIRERRKRIAVPKEIPQYKAIPQRDFTIMAKQAAKKIRRINYLDVDGARVYGYVTSQSGISEWGFKLDFGNLDQLSGQYTEYSENEDSDIPSIVAETIKEAVLAYPDMVLNRSSFYAFCPHCGKRLPGTPENFCPLCGAELSEET